MRCLYCSKKLKSKRTNKKFCNVNCRMAYHRLINRNRNITDNSDKLILSLCDYSGAWSRPYEEAGYDVRRVDIKTGQDVRLFKLPKQRIHGLLAAPPCTDFAVSGACWWSKKGKKALLESMAIFDACARIALFGRARFWVFENPVGRLGKYIGKPRWIFDPCDYGDPYTKKTCLWGDFNNPKPNRISTPEVAKGSHSIDKYWMDKGKTLGKQKQMLRSITPSGFAKAFFKVNQ